MKDYRYLVNKYMKVNKKRSLLTMLGITCSIVLFFTMGYIINYSKDVTKIDSINIFGDYDVALYDVEKESIEKLNNNMKVDKCGFYNIVSETSVGLSNIDNEITIYGVDDVSVNEIFNEKLNIKEGRVPRLNTEIMLNYSLKSQLNISVNDKFKVDEVLYKVVGFYEENEYSRNTIFNGFTNIDASSIDKNINIVFKMKDKNNRVKDIESVLKDSRIYDSDMYDRSKIVLNEFTVNDNRNIYFNENKLLLMCLNLFVLILTIILTYGAINISLSERKKEFASLRCIGATPGKIKKLIIKECIIVSLLSLIPGIIIAQILSWIIISSFPSGPRYINYDILNGKIYVDVIVNTIIFIVINIFLSTIIPLRNIEKLSPIEAIKDNYIKQQKTKKRNSKLFRKIFGYSGELAYKNIRANNKNFIITILTLSLILIATTGFSGYKIFTERVYDENIKSMADLNITFDVENLDIEENLPVDEIMKESKKYRREIKNLNVDSEIYVNTRISKRVILEGTSINKNINEGMSLDSININGKEGVHSNRATILILDKEYANKVIEHINTNDKKIDRLGSNDFIVVNTISNNGDLDFKRVPPLNAKPGDIISLYLQNSDELKINKEVTPIKMNYLGAIESNDLIGAHRFGYYNTLTLIVSEDFYLQHKDVIKDSDISTVNILLNTDKSKNENIVVREISNYVELNQGDLLKEKESEIEYNIKNKVFYNLINTGLVLLILISSVNLINIRNMDIHLRQKELRILLSIGMKKSKLNKMIFLEGIMAWIISSIIGIAISIMILIFIKLVYMEQGYLYNVPIPFYIIFIDTVIILLISIITNIVPYRKFKSIDLNNLIKDEE